MLPVELLAVGSVAVDLFQGARVFGLALVCHVGGSCSQSVLPGFIGF